MMSVSSICRAHSIFHHLVENTIAEYIDTIYAGAGALFGAFVMPRPPVRVRSPPGIRRCITTYGARGVGVGEGHRPPGRFIFSSLHYLLPGACCLSAKNYENTEKHRQFCRTRDNSSADAYSAIVRRKVR